MVDHVVWELSIMFRRADFALFSGGELTGGLSVCPDVLPGEWEPRHWDGRFEALKTGSGHHHAITPDQLRGALPLLSRVTWGQLATVDLFRSRIWLHGRGEGLVFSYSVPNPSHPGDPDEGTLRQREHELRRLRDSVQHP